MTSNLLTYYFDRITKISNKRYALNKDNLELRFTNWQTCSFLNSNIEAITSGTKCGTKSLSKKLMADSPTKTMHNFFIKNFNFAKTLALLSNYFRQLKFP